MKKRIICFLLIAIMILNLCSCGTNKKNDDITLLGIEKEVEGENYQDYLELTNSMIKEIEEENERMISYPTLAYLYINAFYEFDSDTYSFDNFEVTNQKKKDDYTYIVYGKLYYRDNYNKLYYDKVQIIYMAEKDLESSEGYTVSIKDIIIEE